MPDNLSEAVFHKLQVKIINGTYPAGSRLPSERELSGQFRVSRITIRDAVRKLAQLGFVNKVPQSGTYVSEYESDASLDLLIHIMKTSDSVDSDILISLMEFRRLAEVFAAKKAAQNITPEAMLQMNAILLHIEDNLDSPEALSECDYALHLAIARLSHNLMIKLMFNSFKPVYHYYTDFFYRLEDAPARSMEYHKRLVAALGSRDGSFAAHVMEEALLYAEYRVKEALDISDHPGRKIRLVPVREEQQAIPGSR